eukprot:486999-Rhodomonas_salina.1
MLTRVQAPRTAAAISGGPTRPRMRWARRRTASVRREWRLLDTCQGSGGSERSCGSSWRERRRCCSASRASAS